MDRHVHIISIIHRLNRRKTHFFIVTPTVVVKPPNFWGIDRNIQHFYPFLIFLGTIMTIQHLPIASPNGFFRDPDTKRRSSYPRFIMGPSPTEPFRSYGWIHRIICVFPSISPDSQPQGRDARVGGVAGARGMMFGYGSGSIPIDTAIVGGGTSMNITEHQWRSIKCTGVWPITMKQWWFH